MTALKDLGAPHRVDILTNPTGVHFADAWPNRLEVVIAPGLSCAFIGLDDLLANKRAAARPQDLADVVALERTRVPD